VLDERAMPTVPRQDGRQPRVAAHHGVAEWIWWDERVVFGGDDERRHTNPIDHAHGAGAVVIVGRIPEAVMRCGIRLVELAHRPDA
jgi:hypothetical protein